MGALHDAAEERFEMSIEFTKSSPQALAIRERKASEQSTKAFYDFDRLNDGESFTVPIAECNWKSLRTIVYKKNKEFRRGDGTQGREFIFIKHDDLGICEVARIA
jgi:hypothetical protein